MAEVATPYSDTHIAAYPVEYIAGIDLYNAGEFHAAHDAWEDRWMGEVGPQEKLFLQAMIQSAVAFHHLDIGRPGAARQMYLRAKEKFARLGCSVFMSLDLEEYQSQLDGALSWLLTAADPRELPMPEIVAPKIRLLAAIDELDRKSTRLNSSHSQISYAVFCLKKKKTKTREHEITKLFESKKSKNINISSNKKT